MNFVDFLREIYSLAPIRSKRSSLILLTVTANAGCKTPQDKVVSKEIKKSTTKTPYADSQSTYMESDDDNYETESTVDTGLKELTEKMKILKEAGKGDADPVWELRKLRGTSKAGKYTNEVTKKWTDYFDQNSWGYELPEKKEEETDHAYLKAIHQYFQDKKQHHEIGNSLLSTFSSSGSRQLRAFEKHELQQQLVAINENNEEDQNGRRRKL